MNWLQKKRGVVPIDFGEDSKQALDVALEIIPQAEEVHVIHVASDLSAMEPGFVWETLDDDRRRENLDKTFRKRFQDEKYREVHFTIAFGDPGHEIAKFAEELGAGVIVMPSHGRKGITRLLIGSVAERVIRLAHCPVLILRH